MPKRKCTTQGEHKQYEEELCYILSCTTWPIILDMLPTTDKESLKETCHTLHGICLPYWTRETWFGFAALLLVENDVLFQNMRKITLRNFNAPRTRNWKLRIPLQITFLNYQFNIPVPFDSIPNSITSLTFGSAFNQFIESLPSNLRELKFRYRYNKPLPILPSTLVQLRLSTCFNQYIIPGSLPASLLDLRFGYFYQKEILENVLPVNLQSLNLGLWFDCTLPTLPSSLIKLKLSDCFDKPLLLPIGLKQLMVGENYDCPIPKVEGLEITRFLERVS
jgi:hypothetical protein